MTTESVIVTNDAIVMATTTVITTTGITETGTIVIETMTDPSGSVTIIAGMTGMDIATSIGAIRNYAGMVQGTIATTAISAMTVAIGIGLITEKR